MDHLEGYKDEGARDESRAWVDLLEGTVQAALVRDISFLMPCRVHQRPSLTQSHSLSLLSYVSNRRQHGSAGPTPCSTLRL
jgi:hypothetical protein